MQGILTSAECKEERSKNKVVNKENINRHKDFLQSGAGGFMICDLGVAELKG